MPGTELDPGALIRNGMTELRALGAHRQVCGVGGWGRQASISYNTTVNIDGVLSPARHISKVGAFITPISQVRKMRLRVRRYLSPG